MDTWSSGKNKANSNPIQTQFLARIPQITTKKPYFVQENNGCVYKKQQKPNFFAAKSLHLAKNQICPQSVYFLQRKPVIPIRVVFRKDETKLKVYTQYSSVEQIIDIGNKADKKFILGRLGTIFALISYL